MLIYVQLIPSNISSQVDLRAWATEVPRRAINVILIKIQLKPNINYTHTHNTTVSTQDLGTTVFTTSSGKILNIWTAKALPVTL